MGTVWSTDFADYTDFCSVIRRSAGSSPQGTRRGKGEGFYPQMAQMAQILTTEDTGNTEGEDRGIYNNASDGSEGEALRASLSLFSLL